MSKVQGRDTSVFNDLASTTIAGQLESRMKELERNIAVARQFIKLADECYSQVKHEWELLQQDTPLTRPSAQVPRRTTTAELLEEDTPEEAFVLREKKPHSSHDKPSKASGPVSTHTPSIGAKPETPKRKEAEPSNESKPGNPQKEPRGVRPSRKSRAPTAKQ